MMGGFSWQIASDVSDVFRKETAIRLGTGGWCPTYLLKEEICKKYLRLLDNSKFVTIWTIPIIQLFENLHIVEPQTSLGVGPSSYPQSELVKEKEGIKLTSQFSGLFSSMGSGQFLSISLLLAEQDHCSPRMQPQGILPASSSRKKENCPWHLPPSFLVILGESNPQQSRKCEVSLVCLLAFCLGGHLTDRWMKAHPQW